MEVDVNGESRSALTTLPLPVAEASSPGKAEAEKPRCSSTPCSPMRRTVSGYQILHMDSNYLVGFTTGEELLKLAQKCTGAEESKGEAMPSLRSKQLDVGLARSSRLYKTRSRYYQPYEIQLSTAGGGGGCPAQETSALNLYRTNLIKPSMGLCLFVFLKVRGLTPNLWTTSI